MRMEGLEKEARRKDNDDQIALTNGLLRACANSVYQAGLPSGGGGGGEEGPVGEAFSPPDQTSGLSRMVLDHRRVVKACKKSTHFKMLPRYETRKAIQGRI